MRGDAHLGRSARRGARGPERVPARRPLGARSRRGASGSWRATTGRRTGTGAGARAVPPAAPSSAPRLAEAALLPSAPGARDLARRARATAARASILSEVGRNREALAAFEEARTEAHEAGDASGEAQALRLAGGQLQQDGKTDEALADLLGRPRAGRARRRRPAGRAVRGAHGLDPLERQPQPRVCAGVARPGEGQAHAHRRGPRARAERALLRGAHRPAPPGSARSRLRALGRAQREEPRPLRGELAGLRGAHEPGRRGLDAGGREGGCDRHARRHRLRGAPQRGARRGPRHQLRELRRDALRARRLRRGPRRGPSRDRAAARARRAEPRARHVALDRGHGAARARPARGRRAGGDRRGRGRRGRARRPGPRALRAGLREGVEGRRRRGARGLREGGRAPGRRGEPGGRHALRDRPAEVRRRGRALSRRRRHGPRAPHAVGRHCPPSTSLVRPSPSLRFGRLASSPDGARGVLGPRRRLQGSRSGRAGRPGASRSVGGPSLARAPPARRRGSGSGLLDPAEGSGAARIDAMPASPEIVGRYAISRQDPPPGAWRLRALRAPPRRGRLRAHRRDQAASTPTSPERADVRRDDDGRGAPRRAHPAPQRRPDARRPPHAHRRPGRHGVRAGRSRSLACSTPPG